MPEELDDLTQIENDPVMEQFIRDRVMLTPEQRAQQKMQQYIRQAYGVKPESGKTRRVLAGIGESLKAIGAGAKYQNPMDKFAKEGLDEYKAEVPTLQRESAVMGANKRAQQANERMLAAVRDNNVTKLKIKMGDWDVKELEIAAKSDDAEKARAAKEVIEERKAKLINRGLDIKESGTNAMNAYKAIQGRLTGAQADESLMRTGQLGAKQNPALDAQLNLSLIKGIGQGGGQGGGVTQNMRTQLVDTTDAMGNKTKVPYLMPSTTIRTGPGAGRANRNLEMLQQRGIGKDISIPEGASPLTPGTGLNAPPVSGGPVPSGAGIAVGPGSNAARVEQNADNQLANSLSDLQKSFINDYASNKTSKWTGIINAPLGGIRAKIKDGQTTGEMTFDKVNRKQVADFVRSETGLVSSNQERAYLASVLPNKSDNEKKILKDTLLSNFLFQIGMYRKKKGISPDGTTLITADSPVQDLKTKIDELTMRIDLARQGKGKMPDKSELDPITWFEGWLKKNNPGAKNSGPRVLGITKVE